VAPDIARLVQDLVERYLHKLQVRIQPLPCRGRQRIEQVILLGPVIPRLAVIYGKYLVQ